MSGSYYNKTGQYASNWPYVVLSRVHSLDGLYIWDKLEEDPTLYAMPKKLESIIGSSLVLKPHVGIF
jgi:hypothetical protein